jgi:glycoprotein 3-alpha-L-fucosyltransferase
MLAHAAHTTPQFHLSFENSRTRDYVTEKFFQSLEAGVVPVYFGAPNIEDFEPAPNTILHIDDFASPEAVATEMKRLANDRVAYMKMLEWKTTGLSDKFKALFDLNAVHSMCRLCLRTADDFAKQFGETNGGVAPEHLSVPRDDFFHILVRERNAFYFYVVPLDESDLSIAGLHGAILQAFEGYVPIFARHDKLVKLRDYKGKYGVHRVYPPYISVSDTMYGPQALKADADVAALKKGDKLEVIFLETRE